MNKMLRYIFAVVFLTFVECLNAQPVTSVTYDVMLETAENALAANDYSNALEWFEEAYRESKDKDLAVKIARLNYVMRNYERAEKGFSRILKRDRDSMYQELHLEHANSLKALGQFQDAYTKYYNYSEVTQDEEGKAEALFQMEGIKKMGEFEQNIDAVIEFAGKKVNYGQAEYSPSYYNDGTLYYGSFGENKAIEIEKNGPSHYVQLYTSSKDDDGNFQKGQALSDVINREGFHTSNVSFSKDGKRMFFTRSLLEGNQASVTDIYVSYKSDEGWSPAVLLEGVNGDFISTHPVQGELFGNEVLFFVSDMDGGYGGLDVYYATRKGESYGTPVNLGENINTSKDDVTPFYTDGSLYFSSEGWFGMGGLDIFYSTWDGVRWSQPSNLGYGYNTSLDDHYLRFNNEGTKGFLVSNRVDKDKRRLQSKTCCDDIYTVEIREIVLDLLAIVNDENGPLKGANVELFNESIDTESKSKSNLTHNEFNFLLDSDNKYKALITRDGYYPDSVEFNTFGILDDYTVKKTITLKPIPPPVVEPEVEIVTINQAIRLNNIYYDFDDDKILLDAEKDLMTLFDLMNQYPDMVIELSSHTDSQGLSTYNQKLSQRRAQSATDWLVNKGIAAERIKPVGYGESVILNRCKNGVRCKDDEHRFNRRTEFKIIAGPETIEIRKEVIKGADEKKN